MKALPQKQTLCGGFTLIEILVAIAILAMIFSIVFGTFFYTVSNAEEQEERAAIYHRASFILNNISQSVSSAYVPFGGAYSYEDDGRSVFLGTDTFIEDSDADSLSTFTTNPRFGVRATAGGIAYVSYEVASAGDFEETDRLEDENNPFVLRCMVEPLLLNQHEEDSGKVQWTLNIRSLNVEYFDGVEWIQEWSHEDQGMLPDAVRLDLEVAGSEGETYAFSTLSYVHVNTLLEEFPETVAEEEEEEEIDEELEEAEELVEEEAEGPSEMEEGERPQEQDDPENPSEGEDESLWDTETQDSFDFWFGS